MANFFERNATGLGRRSGANQYDINYALNLDLNDGEVYLRKLVEMIFYSYDLAGQGYDFDDVLIWDAENEIAIVNLFGDTFWFVSEEMYEDMMQPQMLRRDIPDPGMAIVSPSRIENNWTVAPFNLASGGGILIQGTASERQEILHNLQLLTDYTLRLDSDNRVQIIHRPADNLIKYPAGNTLVNSLVNSSRTTTIRFTVAGETERSLGGVANVLSRQNSANGTGANAEVVLSRNAPETMHMQLINPNTGAYRAVIHNPSVSDDPHLVTFLRMQTPRHITLAHELIHAERVTRGVSILNSRNFDRPTMPILQSITTKAEIIHTPISC